MLLKYWLFIFNPIVKSNLTCCVTSETPLQYVAGFGKGGTSIPFWEDVYGFNMSCIGKEVVEDSAKLPIVDVVDSRDIMTNAVVIQVTAQKLVNFCFRITC